MPGGGGGGVTVAVTKLEPVKQSVWGDYTNVFIKIILVFCP